MTFLRSMGRYVLLNIGVLLTIFALLFLLETVFGINLNSEGGYVSLLIYSAVIGFAGSIISLFLSKWMAKRSYSITLIENMPTDPKMSIVWKTVETIATRHNITMPEVGYYESQEPNAFATGRSQNNALVAVSDGLLKLMTEKEIEGVVAHEMAHVLNGDMLTMTLMQGVINTFVIFAAHVVSRAIDAAMSKDGERGGLGTLGYYLIYNVLSVVFSLLGSLVIMAFSRWREYRADAGSAQFVGKESMVAALERLRLWNETSTPEQHDGNDELATLKINGSITQNRRKLFASHPDLSDRIDALHRVL